MVERSLDPAKGTQKRKHVGLAKNLQSGVRAGLYEVRTAQALSSEPEPNKDE